LFFVLDIVILNAKPFIMKTIIFCVVSLFVCVHAEVDDIELRQTLSSVKIYGLLNYGSGSLVDNQIITNHHVIENCSSLNWVIIEYITGEHTIAYISEVDTINDLAVLEPIDVPIPMEYRITLKDLQKRNRNPKHDETLLGIGSPQCVGDYEILFFTYEQKRYNVVSHGIDGDSTVLKKTYEVRKTDPCFHSGASGTLFIGDTSCGVLVCDSRYSMASNLMIGRKVIKILKKSRR